MRASVTAPPSLAVVLVDDLAGDPHLCGRSTVDWVLDTAAALAPAALTAAGARAQAVRDRIAARPELAGIPSGEPCATTLVLPCSLPLLRPATLRRLLAVLPVGSDLPPQGAVLAPVLSTPWWAEDGGTAGAVALALAGPHGLDADRLAAATADAAPARECLAAAGIRVRTVRLAGVDALALTDPAALAEAESAVYARIAAGWQARGVRIDDPATTRIDFGVRIEAGARIRPHTELVGATVVGRGSEIGPTTTVRDSRVGADCLVRYSVCQDVEIGDGGNVGPFAWLRSGTRLAARCRVGAYVELADSDVGEGTAIPHLAGLFSADVGRDCNFGAMTGPANFDGARKHRTRIGDGVSIGSCTILVAPVSIGDGASTAAGSVITEDVPGGALALSRVPQRNVAGWAAVRR